MFQNIERDFEESKDNYEQEEKNRKQTVKELIKKSFTKQRILLCIIAFMVSQVSFGINKDLAPFGIAILAAILSNSIPVGIPFIIIGIGNCISFGGTSTLNYVLTTLILLFSVLIKSPKYDEENNEKENWECVYFLHV